MTGVTSEKSSAAGSALTDAALQQGEQLAIQEIESKAGEKAQKAVETAQKVQQGVQLAQSVNTALSGSPAATDSDVDTSPASAGEAAATDEPASSSSSTASADSTSGSTGSSDYIISTVQVELSIGREPVKSFESFTLHQSTGTHHRFELVLPYDVFGGKTENHWMEQSQSLPGKSFSAGFYYKAKENDNKRFFDGIITGVSFRRPAWSSGQIVITGYSPTVLLDGAPHIQSSTGKNLQSIVKDILAQGAVDVNKEIEPKYTGNLIYSCQYNETHFNYLARLAATWGEWFYYTGSTLYFGKPALPDPVKLVFGRDVQGMESCINTAHVTPLHYGYSSSSHENLKAEKFEIDGLDKLGATALQASQAIYKTPAVQVAPARAANTGDVKTTEKSVATAAAAGLFTVKGTSTNPYLYPGCVIDLEVRDVQKGSNDAFARLIVTELKQVLLPNGEYECHFSAIPNGSENLPLPEYIIPVAEPQLATVTSNTDKDNQGRVKVQFPWQQDATDLIRVMTPDAGSSDKVGNNRGLVVIPEVGDQVMIGFIHNNPDRPFVLGGMFHGKIGAGGGSGNNIKSLTSKSGHTVQLNDSGGISVIDKDKNIIELDGAGSISITSNKKIQLKCGESSVSMDSDGNISIAGKVVVMSGTDVGISGSSSVGVGVGKPGAGPDSGMGITPDALDIGTKTLTMSAKTEANLAGETVNIGGGSTTNIVSGEVKLN